MREVNLGGQGPAVGQAEPDVFYVVASASQVKFGITSGDPRPRLGDHRRAGLTREIRLYDGLPYPVAVELEAACMYEMARRGVHPVHGREYFPIAALPAVLDLLDRMGARLAQHSLTDFLAARQAECTVCHGRGGARCHAGCHHIECSTCLGQGIEVNDVGPPSPRSGLPADAVGLLISIGHATLGVHTMADIFAAITPREHLAGFIEMLSGNREPLSEFEFTQHPFVALSNALRREVH